MSQLFSQGKFFRIVAVATLVLLCAANAQSASYKVLYGFGASNAKPSSGLTFDAQGNAYGVTSGGGYNEAGTVYELSSTTGYHLLFKFGKSQAGGAYPLGNLVLDSAGNLYGTTLAGGIDRNCCGLVFELSPPSNGVGLWTETVLHTFCAGNDRCPDGAEPTSGVIFDSSGNLYGTTTGGGSPGSGPGGGTVFEMSPTSTGWTETVLYTFNVTMEDGFGEPQSRLVFDGAGNLYGTTARGGTAFWGSVFELSPAGNNWTETVLYEFGGVQNNDGAEPFAGVVFDAAGNLYGTTDEGGHPSCNEGLGCGTVFELTQAQDGSWIETILHRFAGINGDGEFPAAGVVLDASGSVYGTTSEGGIPGCSPAPSCGTAFRLTPVGTGEWTGDIFLFPGGMSGNNPDAQLTLDSSGNLYGTAGAGGPHGGGVAFKITQ